MNIRGLFVVESRVFEKVNPPRRSGDQSCCTAHVPCESASLGYNFKV